MNHSPNCEEWFIEKMKQNGQKLVELIVVHITTRLMFTTQQYVNGRGGLGWCGPFLGTGNICYLRLYKGRKYRWNSSANRCPNQDRQNLHMFFLNLGVTHRKCAKGWLILWYLQFITFQLYLLCVGSRACVLHKRLDKSGLLISYLSFFSSHVFHVRWRSQLCRCSGDLAQASVTSRGGYFY